MELLIPIALIAIGLGLITVEVWLMPGFNVVGVAGALAVGLGVAYAYVAAGMTGGVLATIAAILAGGTLFVVLWTSGAWDRFILSDHVGRDEVADRAEQDTRARFLGKAGVALSPLRPTGVAEIDGQRLEVLTEGAYIAAGSRVKVVAMDRRRYFVRLAETPETVPAAP